MSKVLIAPSILSANFSAMGDAVKEIEKAGADLVHCDVMDGVFVPNRCRGRLFNRSLRGVQEKRY